MTESFLTTWRKRVIFLALGATLACWLPNVVPGQEKPSSRELLNIPAYVEELDHWAAAVETLKSNPAQAAQLRQKLPERWPVVMGTRPVEVSTSWLRAGLNGIVKDPTTAATAAGPLLEHVKAMRREAQDLQESRLLPDPTARGKMDQILARREFSHVTEPTWLDRMIDRLNYWLARMMERFGMRLSGHSQVVRWGFWVLLIGAAGILLVWMTRRLLQRGGTERLVLSSPELDTALSSRDLARRAPAAAASGDFREATRFAYWAGIHRLEELGLWSVDHTRTHREYLRLVGSEKPERQPLEALTRQFERVWYALQPASQDDFQLTVEQLEKLGCAVPSAQTTNRS